ncbi:hypothetical protein CPB85DRAFT_754078 [Mucidula mucida]|nr:hypothetical protein CPB85DRAFT_754078 [Mucidula mucida]
MICIWQYSSDYRTHTETREIIKQFPPFSLGIIDIAPQVNACCHRRCQRRTHPPPVVPRADLLMPESVRPGVAVKAMRNITSPPQHSLPMTLLLQLGPDERVKGSQPNIRGFNFDIPVTTVKFEA